MQSTKHPCLSTHPMEHPGVNPVPMHPTKHPWVSTHPMEHPRVTPVPVHPTEHPWESVHPIRSTLGSPCSCIPHPTPHQPWQGPSLHHHLWVHSPPSTGPPNPSILQALHTPPSSSQTHRHPIHQREELLPSTPGGGGGGLHPITCGGDVVMGHPHGSIAPSAAATAGARTGSGNARGDTQRGG